MDEWKRLNVMLYVHCQSVLFILDAHRPDTPHLSKEGCEDRGYFSKPKGVREQKCLGNATLAPTTNVTFYF